MFYSISRPNARSDGAVLLPAGRAIDKAVWRISRLAKCKLFVRHFIFLTKLALQI